jgi:hypothetical protein
LRLIFRTEADTLCGGRYFVLRMTLFAEAHTFCYAEDDCKATRPVRLAQP